ncbi:ABC-2 transporter permease [Anaerosphaera multitolerans]|uniref:Uncharacterized protein n=1 Tax=Anaerosphaera multitolerans TaxID=2487351 RepID=A0A437S9A4_9FIRM|nr:ABC-2 transporter permease [Anaerosphaera multitolerans]RVU55696.1 hypothetical protein EF514_00325 [Anaerosphaera multitolerans]
MLNFIKYEIKGSYRFILGVLALTTILNIGNFFYLDKVNYTGPSAIGGIFLGFSFLVIFGMMIATFFYIVNLFRKDLYEDRGYLTFTLPISSQKILASKVLVAFLWFTVVTIGFILSNILAVNLISSNVILSDIYRFFMVTDIPWKEIFALFIGIITSSIITLLIIFFSMTVGRVSIKSKKFKGVWFFIFIFISIIHSLINVKVIEITPYYFNISTLGFEYINNYFFGATFNDGVFIVNLGSILFNILTLLGFFFGTSYLMENHIDL